MPSTTREDVPKLVRDVVAEVLTERMVNGDRNDPWGSLMHVGKEIEDALRESGLLNDQLEPVRVRGASGHYETLFRKVVDVPGEPPRPRESFGVPEEPHSE